MLEDTEARKLNPSPHCFTSQAFLNTVYAETGSLWDWGRDWLGEGSKEPVKLKLTEWRGTSTVVSTKKVSGVQLGR